MKHLNLFEYFGSTFGRSEVDGSKPSDDISKKLILLKRKNPTAFEIHVGQISQSKNLLLTVYDEEFATRLVNGFNEYKPKK